MRILITGCRGFVGSSVGHVAHARGHEVLGVANSSQAPADWPGKFAAADVTHSDLAPLIRDFKPEMVLHAAGSASVGASIANPIEDFRAALYTWTNTLDGIRRSSLKPRVIFPSSAAVYGNPATLPVKELAPVQPLSPYGFHKAACELIAREYAQCFGIDVIVCRLFSIYGPRQRRLLVWELASQLAGPNEQVTLEGTGNESRDYLHIDDIAEVFLRLADPSLKWPDEICPVLNVAFGRETSVRELAQQLQSRIAPKKPIHAKGVQRPGDPLRWQADVTKLRTLLPQWSPRKLADGLEQCIDYWKRAAERA